MQEPRKKARDSSTQRTNDNCWNRYLITTYYDKEGNYLETVETYLGTYCYPCGTIGPDGNSVQCTDLDNDDGSGSGGGGSNVYEYEATRPVDWNPYTSPDGYNVVRCFEYLHGTRAANNNSTFSKITYNFSQVDNYVGPMDNREATWHKNDWFYALSGDKKTGTTTIDSLLTYRGGNYIEVKNKTKTWTAHTDL